MNTNSELDRIVQGFLEDRVAAPPRAELLRDSLAQTSATAQTRRRFLGRWLDRDEGAGRPAHGNKHRRGRNRPTGLMLGATGLVAAFGVLAISLEALDPGPVPPSVASTTRYAVAMDGSGDYDSIQAAVDAASAGDTVAIAPGNYVESVIVDKDLTIVGDGPSGEVVLNVPEDGPLLASADRPIRYAFHLDGAEVSLGNLTIEGSGKRMIAVVAEGGRPTIHDVSLDFGQLTGFPRSFVHVGAGAEATVRDSRANARLDVDDAVATVANLDTTGPDSVNGLVVRVMGESEVLVAENRLNGVVVHGGRVLVDRNELFAPDNCAVSISGQGAAVTATANTVRDSESGFCASGRATATIASNEVFDSGVGISLGADDLEVHDNLVRDNDVGILFRVGSPTVDGNTVTDNRVGLEFGSLPTTPIIADNDICRNENDLRIAGSDEPPSIADQVC